MANEIVPREEINAMKNLLQIMNGNSSVPQKKIYQGQFDPNQIISESHTFTPCATVGLSDNDIKDMRNILEKFNRAAGDSVKTLVEDARYDSELKEALITSPTKKGTKIGAWEIRVKVQETKSGKQIKHYDVINHEGEKIATNLCLYEAAYGIVKCLTKGMSPLSKNIREIMELEEKYNQFKSDALRFKSKSIQSLQNGDSRANAIFESRYDDHKDKALLFYRKLKSIVKVL